MYYVYCKNLKGDKRFLTNCVGVNVEFTKVLAKQQLTIFEQLPHKSRIETWHMIKFGD
jgi:hypothetical protein